MLKQGSAERQIAEWLFQPCPVEEFTQRYYERAPLHIPRNRSGYYREYFSLFELERILFGARLGGDSVRLNKDGILARRESYVRKNRHAEKADANSASDLLDPDRVSAMFARGCSLIFDTIEPHSDPMARLCRALETYFRHRVSANVYMTPANSQGFAPHYDTHDAVILQIEGSKHWRVYGTPFELPLQSQQFDKKKHAVREPEREICLQPGDLLYIPRGMVHDAKAGDSFSLHVTLGLYPMLWIDILREALSDGGDAEIFLRKSTTVAATPAAARGEEFSTALERIFSFDRVTAAAERIERKFVTERRNGLEGQLHQLTLLTELSEDSVVTIRQHMLYELEESSETTKLTFSGKVLMLPKGTASFVRAIESSGCPCVGTLVDPYERAVEWTRNLIQEGFLIQLESDGGDPHPQRLPRNFTETGDTEADGREAVGLES